MANSAQGVEFGGEVVRLGTDDDLHDVAGAHDAERAGLLETCLVNQLGVCDLDAQPGDTWL